MLQGGYDACRIYDLNYTADVIDVTGRGATIQCEKWQYDGSVFKENIVTEVGIQYHHNTTVIAIPWSSSTLTNSIAYETRRFNAHSQGLSNNPHPEPNRPNSSY